MKLFAGLLTILIALTAVDATAQVSSKWECDDLAAYQSEIVSLLDREEMVELFDLMEMDVDRMRPTQIERASELLDQWATALDDMPARDIPRAAREYHALLIESLGMLSATYNTIANGGILGALVYIESLEEIAIELEEVHEKGRDRCGDDWDF